MGRASRQKREGRERREADMRHTLAALAAGGKLDTFTRWEGGEEVAYIHVPPEHRHSRGAIGLYVLSCLPDAAPAAADEE